MKTDNEQSPFIASDRTSLYAILGNPIRHALSPIIHNSGFRALNMDKVFIALPTDKDSLSLAMEAVRKFNFKGFAITMPLKETVVEHLDHLSDEAGWIGAVNTVVNESGVLAGFNTDSRGLGASIKAIDRDPETFFLFVAGGVAKAISSYLCVSGKKKLYITNRHSHRSECLAGTITQKSNLSTELLPWEPSA